MAWQTKVAAWVIPLVAEYAIPDNAEVFSDVELGSLDDATGAVTVRTQTRSVEFPGLIPNFSLAPTIRPQTDGVEYILRARKAVGYHTVVTTVIGYDSKRLNSWTFPIDRKNFGFIALTKGDAVEYSGSIIFAVQYHSGGLAVNLLTNYDSSFDGQNVFNEANKNSLNKAHIYLSPSVEVQISFLPVWETWIIKYVAVPVACPEVRVFSLPPGVEGVVPSEGFREGDLRESVTGELWILRCDSQTSPAPVWLNLGISS